MGISFKVSNKGSRFHQRKHHPHKQSTTDNPAATCTPSAADDVIQPTLPVKRQIQTYLPQANQDADHISDSQVSFTFNLLPDGYSITKPTQNDIRSQTSNLPKSQRPYDTTSDALFTAIESGRLPGDALDDLPCKYVDGSLVCEVRDYRNCSSEPGIDVPSANSPVVSKVRLRMSLENVVKDIPLISNDAWTYGDLMEVESRILKALQPQLCLDPTPKLDRLCENHVSSKLNFALCRMRRKRLRQIPEATTSNNKIHGKKTRIDGLPENSSYRLADSGTTMQPHVNENFAIQNGGPSNMLPLRPRNVMPEASVPTSSLGSHQSKYQMGVGNSKIYQDSGAGPISNAPGGSPAGQDMLSSYTDNMNTTASSFHGKRENQDGQLSPLSSLNKRARLSQVGLDGGQQQHIGQQMDGFHGTDSHWKNTLMQQQTMGRGLQYANPGMQRYPQQMFEGGFSQEGGALPLTGGQQGLRYGLKEEPVEIERMEKSDISGSKIDMHMMEGEMNRMDSQQSRQQHRLPQMRSSFPQTPWNSLGQPLENISRKEDQFQKRKLVQSPRVSAGGLPQSPLSSKSGEFSSGSVGAHFGAVAATAAFGSSQKEKAVTSVHAIGGTTSLASSANDSMHRQQQAQNAAKRRSSSLTKTPLMSGVGSPASVSNMGVPLNASSPPVGTPPLGDQIMLDRFTKIELVTARFKVNCKKNRVDDHPLKKSNIYSAQQLMHHLSSDANTENLKDESCKMPLSKSLVGGSMNVCKTRVLNFVPPDRSVQVVAKSRNRMIMSEKPNDGTVAMHYGEIEDADYLAAEDYLPTLPNTHIADLLAAQICSMMIREGYTVEDHVQPKPVHMNRAPGSYSNATGIPTNASAIEMHATEAVSTQPSNEITKPSNGGMSSLNSSQNMSSTRMLPSGNTQPLQISQGLLAGGSMPSKFQQPDSQQSLQQQLHQNQQQSLLQQQHHQFQRSPLMLAANPLSHLSTMGQSSSMQLGNQIVNKPSPLQLQMLQQQQQQLQSQQPQMQRKMMMGIGNVGMGNMGNNMVGLQGLGNMMGMGASRGVGGAGISAPMGSISGLNNVGQSTMNLSQAANISNAITQQLRSGQLTPAQAALMATKLRMQNRTNMLGSAQSNIGGMSGARQMHPGSTGLSMLGPTLNRATISPMQRTGMGPMGPPKLMNAYMNQQQQQQQQQQQLQLTPQQMQQFQQQQLQQQQQQQETSPLQAVTSPPQVGSPSNMGIQQQLNPQSQQQQQDSSQQMSQRTPMSPQISSGAMHPLSAGNQEGCPASPQLSSQTLGSVGSITNSPMELQGGNKTTSAGNS
ncbi:protein PHYTOCHROME-DEPENDENT LATE-FLOWERING [Daucus carota subsp. sativus]|uniref:protein PHYTOCHROME-DEPENDENT LATE-FLOWERING n=1 Tax=Daucus carota subsp. sativus TaxID=79200 RepID=UPI0007EF2503|nr:PREDICTED: uncharacterized protein LOC108195941 [Daucus carota subsp. sativus]